MRNIVAQRLVSAVNNQGTQSSETTGQLVMVRFETLATRVLTGG
jgi:hypothetical protein